MAPKMIAAAMVFVASAQVSAEPAYSPLMRALSAAAGGRQLSSTNVTEADVLAVQAEWRKAVLDISNAYLATPQEDFVDVAKKAIQALYGYEMSAPVMFKPTLAAEEPFRPTSVGALSYFVGYDAIKPEGQKEDKGFAINGGDGWNKVVFKNDLVHCMKDVALTHGYYYFTNAKTGVEVAVEYSFVYQADANKKLKIILHHSSVPYSAKKAVTEADVLAVQAEWRKAVLDISNAYLATPQEDFVDVAKKAIQALYGYEMSSAPVMFKPTLAAEEPFRPKSIGALSYFVGYDAIKPEGQKEDKGFAINGGEGWNKVVFKNDLVYCMEDVALTHGYYYFTNAKTGVEVAVEYSFVYLADANRKLKIILHHSSVPYSPTKK